jgi:hypothetical protein
LLAIRYPVVAGPMRVLRPVLQESYLLCTAPWVPLPGHVALLLSIVSGGFLQNLFRVETHKGTSVIPNRRVALVKGGAAAGRGKDLALHTGTALLGAMRAP